MLEVIAELVFGEKHEGCRSQYMLVVGLALMGVGFLVAFDPKNLIIGIATFAVGLSIVILKCLRWRRPKPKPIVIKRSRD